MGGGKMEASFLWRETEKMGTFGSNELNFKSLRSQRLGYPDALLPKADSKTSAPILLTHGISWPGHGDAVATEVSLGFLHPLCVQHCWASPKGIHLTDCSSPQADPQLCC